MPGGPRLGRVQVALRHLEEPASAQRRMPKDGGGWETCDLHQVGVAAELSAWIRGLDGIPPGLYFGVAELVTAVLRFTDGQVST